MTNNKNDSFRKAAARVDQRGAGVTEFGLLGALIAIVAIGAVALTGDKVAELFDGTANSVEMGEIPGGNPPPPPPPDNQPNVTVTASTGSIPYNGAANFAWNATNADEISARYNLSGGCTRANSESSGNLAWSGLSGSDSLAWAPDLAGCTYTATVTAAKGATEKSDSASVSVAMLDTTPETLSFNNVTGVEPNTPVYSATETVSNVDGSVTVAVSGEGGVAAPGSTSPSSSLVVAPGDGVRLFVQSHTGFAAEKQVHWTAGGRSGTWTVTTRDRITAPIALDVPDLTDLPLDEDATSVPVTVLGFDGPLTVTASNGATISVEGGAFTASVDINPGQSFRVRLRSAPTTETTLTSAVQVGDATDTWHITTRAPDYIPDAFGFGADRTDLAVNTTVFSDTVTFAGFDGQLSLALNATPNAAAGTMSYSFNGGAFTPLSGSTDIVSVTTGNTLQLSFQSAASTPATAQSIQAIASIGGISATWTAGTAELQIVGGAHTTQECIDAGGTRVLAESGNYVCRFNAAACPAGWTTHLNWSAAGATTCNGTGSTCHGSTSCTTGSRTWSNSTTRPSCTYNTGWSISGKDHDCKNGSTPTCTATITQVGCK